MKLGRRIEFARPAVLAPLLAVLATAVAQAQPPTPTTTAERAAFYDRLAKEQSTKTLEQLVRDALAAKPEPSPHFVIEALLDRYFELDPAAAVRFAGELPSPPLDVARTLYARLARSNANAALAALSLVDDPTLARVAATAILEAVGKNLAAIELVAAALHAGDVDQFRAEALVAAPSIPPREALAAALRLRDAARRNGAVTTIVMRWAQDAPRDAMEETQRVPDPALRSSLRRAVLENWSDTESLLAYLSGLDDTARRAALRDGVPFRLAQADPERAAVLAQSLPAGPERSAALQQVALVYAQKDATAAFQWVRRLDPPEPELLQSVIRDVATREPLQAFELVESLPEPARLQAYFLVVGSGGARDARQFEQLAERVAALPEGQNRQTLLASLVLSRAQDPNNLKPALEWALAHAGALPPEAFVQMGYSLAQSDPDAAGAYLDRVPSAARGRWIGATASGYLRSDPQRALAFVERFRGDPAYDEAAAALAPQLASIDPPGAARLLASVGTRPINDLSAEVQIAHAWAERDPQAAATWALDLPPMQRGIAMNVVVQQWGQSNPRAARDWALALAPSDKRDFALSAALRAQGPGAPDPALLAAFSDDRQRQGALMTTIMMTASSDAPLARRLIEEHITDPRLRAQAEQMVESAARGGVALPTGVRSPVTGFPVQTGVLLAPGGAIDVQRDTIGAPPPPVLLDRDRPTPALRP